jgi:high-affinity nickel-transport protein
MTLRTRLVVVFGALGVFNLGAWTWALIAFQHRPVLLGVALVIYGLGLRHAIDADHIAAIDNVTRKLMQDDQRPVGVGFFFALGHSSLVVLVTAAVASLATALGHFEGWREIGGLVSTTVSAFFLLAIAVMNIVIFRTIHRSYRRLRRGESYVDEDLDLLLNNRGFLARLLRPLFRLITRSWHMFPLGFLFGLGFDTATEVAMFGVSAAQVAKGVPFAAILVFPALFAAGMSLVDTADGVLMLGAYDWAFVKPMRKLYYNMTITLISVAIALLIGGVEALGLIRSRLDLSGGAWDIVRALADNMNRLGMAVIGLFVVSWLASYAIYKAKNLDAFETAARAGR